MTLRLRETFIGLSTSRLSIFTPLTLYKALPEWLNDGHQQDAAEFTQYVTGLLYETWAMSVFKMLIATYAVPAPIYP